jgi:uncharacterized protein YjbJ (UPF0337 family)
MPARQPFWPVISPGRGGGGPVWRATRAEHVSGKPATGKNHSKASESTREGNAMVDINSGLAEAVKGVVEDVKGKAKVIVGAVIGRDDLFNEGKAQQDKAQAQRNAAKKEAEAQSARAAAKIAEKRQQAEQN